MQSPVEYNQDGRPLQGKTAVVTGASRGIGAAIAIAMAHAGAKVVINYLHSPTEAERIRRHCEKLGTNAIAVQADVRDKLQAAGLMEASTELGLPSILVNNAGTSLYKMFEDTTLDECEAVFASNVTGTFLCTQAALPYLKLGGAQGRIINLSSIWGISGAAGESIYSATKGAVIALTRSLAKELGSTGITVNAIAPGAIATDMLEALAEEDKKMLRDEIPLRRLGTPEDVAHAAVFLASAHASYITGEVLRIDGGFSR